MESCTSAPTGDFGTPGGAVVPPTSAPAETTHKFVSFYLSGKLYAIHSSAVAEVTTTLAPRPLPDCPPSLAGVAPLRGEIVAVIDLGALPESGMSASGRQKAIVLKTIDPEIEIPVAFNVDAIGELISVDLATIRELADPDGIARFEATVADGPVGMIEASRLLSLLNGPLQ